MPTIVHFEIPSDDIERSKKFYNGCVAYQKTGHQNVDELGPATESTIEFVNNVNNIKKIVFLKTLKKVVGNAILIKENIAVEISKMKQRPGKDLMLKCGTGLASTFIQFGLIDEYRIGAVPIILGGGKSLFKALKDRLNLKLLKLRHLIQVWFYFTISWHKCRQDNVTLLLEALIRMR